MIEKVYIVHYGPLTDRKEYLDEQIPNRFGFNNVEFIISDELTDSENLKNTNYSSQNSYWSQLTIPEICNYEVQYNIWNKIAVMIKMIEIK